MITYPGKENTVTLRFIKDGTPHSFLTPVKWRLMDEDDGIILSGIASDTGNGIWSVTFTIPSDYSINGDSVDLYLEVYGTDIKKVARSREVEVTVMNYADSFEMDTLVYYQNKPIEGYLITPKIPAIVSYTIENGAGEVKNSGSLTSIMYAPVLSSPLVPNRFEDDDVLTSYKVKVSIVSELEMSTAPYLVKYEVVYEDNTTDSFIHQLYWTNNRLLSTVMKLNSYLNKARLIEIDQSLQWMTEELVGCVYSGLEYINGYVPELTYWNFNDLPQPLSTYFMYSAAFHALNMRYLAEGMTAFQFTGLNTSVEIGRSEALTYKIEEIKDILGRLELAKKSAIRTSGTGTPDPTTGATSVPNSTIGFMGIQFSPVTNAKWMGPRTARWSSRLFRTGF